MPVGLYERAHSSAGRRTQSSVTSVSGWTLAPVLPIVEHRACTHAFSLKELVADLLFIRSSRTPCVFYQTVRLSEPTASTPAKRPELFPLYHNRLDTEIRAMPDSSSLSLDSCCLQISIHVRSEPPWRNFPRCRRFYRGVLNSSVPWHSYTCQTTSSK